MRLPRTGLRNRYYREAIIRIAALVSLLLLSLLLSLLILILIYPYPSSAPVREVNHMRYAVGVVRRRGSRCGSRRGSRRAARQAYYYRYYYYYY